ncbi:MAG: hypothetical protein HY088_04055 [Ignavibacteriales bacterium]|nr:hypothetical protein [Ignavibacteriales bacterium]
MKIAACAMCILFLFVIGCERPVDSNVSPVFSLSERQVLQSPSLSRPKYGGISTTEQVTLRWREVTDAGSYSVELAYDSLFVDKVAAAKTDTTLFRTPQLRDHQYFWRVKAYNSNGLTGAWSEVWLFTVKTLN